MNHRLLPPVALLALFVSAALPAAAQEAGWRPDRVVLQAGPGHSDGVVKLSLGLAWQGSWQRQWGPVRVGGQVETLLNHWRARDFAGGRQGYQQLVLLPSLRFGLDEGRSPWFLEFGIGASWMDRRYVGPDKDMSTQWNFYDMAGAGRRFGAQDAHELGLRWVHISNAGIRKPNPGEDFVLLRYALRF